MATDRLKRDFGDEKKVPLRSPLAAWERQYIDRNVMKLPGWLRSWQLTLLTLPFAAGLVLFGWLAGEGSRHWLWLSSLLLVAQWWTDCMDGTLGRVRGEGLVKWGYYMDHFGDFLFMSAAFIGWSLLMPAPRDGFLMLMCMFAYDAMMVSCWLMFGALQRLQITFLGVGPTEIRLFFVVVNTVIIFGGPEPVARALPWALGAMAAILAWIVVQGQRALWRADKEALRHG